MVDVQAVEEVEVVHPRPDHYLQRSGEVWAAACATVKRVLQEAGVAKEQVKGLGFDATCSLVVVGKEGASVAVECEGEDIIMWMDHRAREQAAAITATRHELLESVGGTVSLEMQVPKLLWLATQHPQAWAEAAAFYDLPDWLVHKATGSSARSLCSLVCKWLYRAGEGGHGWDWAFLEQVGLGSLTADHLGATVLAPGAPVGQGLSAEAARELGLCEGTRVGASLIDAHAGALGLLASPGGLLGRLGLVCGTSTCHMLLAERRLLVPGVWGPFHSAICPGLWLTEGGMSSTGGLLDHIIRSHTALPLLPGAPEASPHAALATLLSARAGEEGVEVAALARDVHVWPDYHGNRSPLADPRMKGAVVGLTLSRCWWCW